MRPITNNIKTRLHTYGPSWLEELGKLANGSPAPRSGSRVGSAVLEAEELLDAGFCPVVVETDEVGNVDSELDVALGSSSDEVSTLEFDSVELVVVVDVVSVDDGASDEVVADLGTVTVIEAADVVEGLGVSLVGAAVEVRSGSSTLQSAFTKFPRWASQMSEFGCASTVSHDARMLACTRARPRWHVTEQRPAEKSAIWHPLMGVL